MPLSSWWGRLRPPERSGALVYRGPASLPGCAEAAADVLQSAGLPTRFVGPGERRRLSAHTLQRALVYAQPGGPDLEEAWPHLEEHARDIQEFVRAGGNYLGFCLGGYLAGNDPGFGLLPGDTDQYILSPGATIRHDEDAVVRLDWGGREVAMYFQDAPYFDVDEQARVLATYDNGLPAAVTCAYGKGRVGVVGPHPEATDDWFTDVGLRVPDPLPFDVAVDLIRATVPSIIR